LKREIHVYLSKWLLAWRETDPGFSRLRLALRTTAAAFSAPLVVWYLQHWQSALSGIAPLCIAFLTGMLMIMTTFGETRRIQKQSFILAGGTGLLMVLIETALHQYHFLEVAAFMLVSFLVFYIRRFGVRYTGISIYAMTIFLMCTVMNTHAQAWHGLVGGVSIGVGVTYVINFYLLPNTPLRTFLDSIPPFLRKSAQVLNELEPLILGDIPPAESAERLHVSLQNLQVTVLISENLLSNLRIGRDSGRALFRKCCLDEYRISSTLLILADHLQHAIHHHGLPQAAIQKPVHHGLRETRFLLLRIAASEGVPDQWMSTLKEQEKCLDELINFLEETEARDTFRLYYILQTVFALKRILDATTELNRNWIEARQLL